MHCPKCQSDMSKLTVETTGPTIEVDRCNECHGIWFDNGELDIVANHPEAAVIDTGSTPISKDRNTDVAVRCPRCTDVVMYRDVADGHEHISVERCPGCNGRFLDAGELKHLASNSVLEKMRAMVARLRR